MFIGFILYIVLGWLAAIAVNHAADTLPTRKALLKRPVCLACGAERRPQQWSVLVAWSSGRQHCYACGQPRRYLVRSVIVELLLPGLFAFLLRRYGLSWQLLLTTIYTVILVLVTVTDLEHRLIFNVVMLPGILFAMIVPFVVPGLYWRVAMAGGVGAFVVVYLAALLSRGGLGQGDVTLSTFLGFVLGFPHIVLSLMFGVFLGGFVALVLLISGKVGMRTFIPYGPFLTITGWIMLIWGDAIWQYYFF